MPSLPKTRYRKPYSADSIQAEIARSAAALSQWLEFLSSVGSLQVLFELEVWLKGIEAFLDTRNLSLTGETSDWAQRNFSPELHVLCQALQVAERSSIVLLEQSHGASGESTNFLRRFDPGTSHVLRGTNQGTPLDSLLRLHELLLDLHVQAESMRRGKPDYRFYLSLAGSLRRGLRECRFVDMLLNQAVRREFDRVESQELRRVLKEIPDEALRRSVGLSLVHMFRILRYLRLVAYHLEGDRPLRRTLVIFALIHREMGQLAEYLRAHFLNPRGAGPGIWSAVELLISSMKMESHRVYKQELGNVLIETNPDRIYSGVENSHGLLRSCIQSGVIALAQSIDRRLDPKSIFPSIAGSAEDARRLRHELWDLRLYMCEMLEKPHNRDVGRILRRVAFFKETNLGSLMYRDWEQFESFCDLLIRGGPGGEAESALRDFTTYLETLVHQVSKRSILRELSSGETSQPTPT